VFHRLLMPIALGLSLIPPTAAQASAASPALPQGWTSQGAPVAAAQRAHRVTLLTGDQVQIQPQGDTAAVTPGPGRAGVTFHEYTLDGHRYVVPSDATALVSAGQVDSRLFDVTGLIADGYDDAARADLPLIVGYTAKAYREQATSSAGSAVAARVARRLPSVRGTAIRADKAGKTWASLTTAAATGAPRRVAAGLAHVWLDGKRQISLDQSVPQIGAPAAWQAGYSGQGVTVAVLDTGIDDTHPDVAARIVDKQNFTSTADTGDHVGHGTHVASTIAGSGARSGGRYVGVAPQASLLIGKVCGTTECFDSDMLAGMEWAAPRAKVINMSLGGPDTPGVDPLEEAVNTLTAQTGALFVIAAGNDGRDSYVSSPASADAALAVGAVDKQDQLAGFSNRGPRVGDGAVKPDITAPGVDIVAALSKDSAYPEYAPGYTQLSGTSMATPHVAGAAALLAQQHPEWTAPRLKAALMASAKPNPALDVFAQGAGRVDVAKAITQAAYAEPASMWLGSQPWPPADDQPVSRVVTLHNDGPAPLTFDLAAQATGPAGAAAPAGLLTANPSRVTVPAGGTADTMLTADTRVDSVSGMFTGALIGTAGSVSVRVPFAVEKGFESRTLTIEHLDRAGAPAASYSTFVLGVDADTFAAPFNASGTAGVRLRVGRYFIASTIVSPGDGSTTMLVWPTFTLGGDATITLDARRGAPISVSVPRKSARSTLATSGYRRITPSGYGLDDMIRGTDFGKLYTAQVGGELGPDAGALIGNVYSGWAEPGPAGDFADTPYEYRLAWFTPNKLPTGFARAVKQGELATVRHEFHTEGGERGGVLQQASFPPEGGQAPLVNIQFAVPGSRTVYYTTQGQQWRFTYYQLVKNSWNDTAQQYAEPQTLRAGRSYARQWENGPLGFNLNTESFAQRMGNTLRFNVPPFSDQNPSDTGYSLLDTGATSFSRDGVKVVDLPTYFYDASGPLPPTESTYRLETTVDRSTGYDTSTVIHAAWTFRSAQVAADRWYPVSLLSLRFLPKLELDNAAVGRAFTVPLAVTHQDGGTGLSALGVEASYDDGKTWRPVRATPAGPDRWQLSLPRPGGAAARYISLRATATDNSGNTAEYSVLRAYRVSGLKV